MKRYFLLFTLIILTTTSYLSHAEDDEDADGIQYVEIKPSLITNYQADRLSYLKADITLQVTGSATADAIDRHLPSIRHNLIMLFSRQEGDNLSTTEGKSKLKDEALTAVVEALEVENEPTKIEAILFTSFIVE